MSNRGDGAGVGAHEHVLLFLAGNHQGNELVLRDGTYTMGRGLDVAFTLEDETLSRRHAQFVVTAERIRVEDMGSTNGTFVNGVQVTGAVLKEGDAVVVGACLIKYRGLRAGGEAQAAVEADAHQRRRALYDRASADRKTSPEALAGDLQTFPFTTLAQLLAASSASGCLLVEGARRKAEIYLRGGRLVAARLDGGECDLDPEKIFLRVLRWSEGKFVLAPEMELPPDASVSLDINMLMLEGMRVLDELGELQGCPEPDELLFVPEPILPPLRELTDEQLDTLQLVHNYHHVETVLDRSLASDLDTLRDIVLLLERGYAVFE